MRADHRPVSLAELPHRDRVVLIAALLHYRKLLLARGGPDGLWRDVEDLAVVAELVERMLPQ